jgi:PAS domain S-box-containing protein
MRVIDKDFNVLKINDTFSNISHISKKEAVGKKCYDLLSSSRCHTYKCPLTQILCGENCVKDDVDEKRKDGEITPCFVTATPFRDPDGNIMGIVENLQDITELKRDEQALRKSEKRLRFLSSQLLKIQEKERKRIARELHDGIGQLLNTIKYSVENVLSHKGRTRPSSAIKTLGAVNPIIQNSIEEVRRICTDLRPPILDDLGILATISSFCHEFNTIYPDIYIEKKVSIQEEEIPDILKTDIYRIMQEAFNNIAKYSKADLVSFFLKKINGSIELTIQDNGLGFDLEATYSRENSKKGFGLTSMRERTELSGGFFSIKSISGDGTIVHASWPCECKDSTQN